MYPPTTNWTLFVTYPQYITIISILAVVRAGSRGGGGGGGLDPPPPPNPENQFENGAKFLCLKDKGRTISLLLHQKCFNVNSSGHKEPIFNHLMPKVPKPGCGLESECGTGKKNFRALMRSFWAPPYFKSWIHPWW